MKYLWVILTLVKSFATRTSYIYIYIYIYIYRHYKFYDKLDIPICNLCYVIIITLRYTSATDSKSVSCEIRYLFIFKVLL